MLKLSTARRAACSVVLALVALTAWAQTNSAPQIVSQPSRIATVKLGFDYAVRAQDADGDTLRYLMPTAPVGATIDAGSGAVKWRPAATDLGRHAFVVAVEDGKTGRAEQPFELKVVEDFCSIYPIALPKTRVDGLTPGASIDHMERGTGAGNFSWLTWTGATDAPTMAGSLTPPGDSDTYVDPDDATDHLLNIGDWTQGSTGSMNSAAIRAAMDVLKTIDIILPVWDETRGQGARYDYHVQRFVTVRLRDYQLTGQGWLSFEYKGEATCYNRAPTALPQSLETNEDTPLPIVLTGTDPEGDALTYTVLDQPSHGTLSGTAPTLTYTPATGYVGHDSFNFRVNDGQLDSAPARIDIEVLLVNAAPTIVSPPVTVATEAQPYRYDVDATDPDNDTLVYSLDRTPDALAIQSASGVIQGVVDTGLLQPVRAFNGQCYILPDDAGLEDPDGTIIAPLFQRVRRAITKGSDYASPQTRAWHQTHGCLGCHVQNQTLLGLQGSMERAKVDEATAEFLLAEILASQQSDGSIRRSHPEFSGNQTAFALWALSYVPDHARTFVARERALRFFLPRTRTSGIQIRWDHDHPSGWLSSPEAATALVAIGIDRFVRDASRLPNVTPTQVALALELRGKLPGVAEYFLARSSTTNNNMALAFTMMGLAQAQPHLDDAALRARVDERIALLNTRLRERSRAAGGWSYTVGGAVDPLTSAWVGFALDTLDPPLTDPVVVNNIKYLLDAQVPADGTWRTSSGLFTTHLATTGLVMAYLPIALEHLGNPDLTLGHMKLEEQADGRFVLSVEAMNRGLADVNVDSAVRFFAGREASGTLLGETTAAALSSGETRWISITLDALPEGDVSASIQASSPITECVENNNFTRAGLVIDRATDPYGLFDTQPYLVNLEDANAAPVITSEPVTSFEQGKPYDYQVTVTDADVGDAHEFELRTAPAGLYINPLNGKFSYDLQELAAGTHTVKVRVTDLRGLFAEQTFQLVIAPNHPPEITSTPTLRVYLGDTYRYDVDATDPDDDTLQYRLDGAPLTMSIDAVSGAISWTPESRHLGDNAVAVLVDDGRGGTDRQTWTIRVETLPVNRAPTITTTAPPSVNEGQVYRYDIDATDPDNDVLQYGQVRAPQGASVVAASGVLSWTANDAQLVSGIRAQNQVCRTAVDLQPFQMEEKWAWTGSSQQPNYDQVLSTALVAPLFDHNHDNKIDQHDAPSVVFLAFLNDANAAGRGIYSARMRVIDGRTGAEQWVTDSTIDLDGHGTPAIGDIDADGKPDIVTQTADGGAAAFNADGSLKWRAPPIAGATRWRVAHIADLTGDGSVEIVIGDAVLDSHGAVLWRLTEFRGAMGSLVPGLVSIADINGDGSQEIVAGASAYSATGTVLWKNTEVGDGSTALADFDLDGRPEVVVVKAGTVWLVRTTDGSKVWGPVSIPGGGQGGPPTVGDMNGDGTPEIGVAGATRYAAISAQGQVLWTGVTQDSSSNVTGSTIADLDGDGRAEVLYRDELYFRIYDGSTGAVLEQEPMSSVTAVEYPVVADIDLDGEAEILVTADDLMQRMGWAGGPRIVGVHVFASGSGAWTPTRSIWNQHAYHIDNINDDGSVPRHPVKSWLTHNTFRLNTFADRHPLGLADLALFDLRLNESDGSLSVLVSNRGLAPTTATTSVRLYNGDPNQGGTLLGEIDVPALASGEERTLTLNGLAANAVNTNVFARVDEAGTITECLDDNNGTAAAYFDVRATDPAGLFDGQRFTVTVENVNEAPSLEGAALPTAAIGQAYRYTLQASDPDLGDALRFELASAPTGLSIEAVSGELRWTPSASQAGTHAVRARVVDLGGLSVERSFELVVSTNQAPQITSTPGNAATVGTEYRYDVDATDPEGDALTYGLTTSPNGMLIDGSTGLIRWTPTAAGSHEIEVRVLDARGAFTLQRYTLVVAGPVNHAPTISSVPSQTASPGRLYTYLVDATDPDNDTLSVLLPVKPAGMTLNELTGQISWTPTAAQLGTQAVQVQVIDGRGGVATQNFNIVVSEVSGNQPPSIVSTPVFTAKVGREYRYVVEGQDPDGDTLTYSLMQAPSGMTIAANGTITWTPSTTASQTVRVRVADAGAFAEQTWTISVLAADVPLNAVVTITPTPVQPGGTVTIQIVVEGAAAQPTVTATLDGQPLPLDPDGTTTLTAPTTPGSHPVVVTVTDGHDTDTTSTTIQVVDPSDTTAPAVELLAPVEHPDWDAVEISQPAAVNGRVTGADTDHWVLGLQARGSQAVQTLAQGAGEFTARDIATFDPTLLLNGLYTLTLQASDRSGNTAFDSVILRVTGDMKLGHYSITFEEVSIPVAGIPVTVNRTYDTRRASQSLDFGHGWTVDANNVRVQESRRVGFAWDVFNQGGTFGQRCIRPLGDPIVTVTLPDGEVASFKARAEPECRSVFDGDSHVQLVFDPIDGTDHKLEQTDYGTVRWGNVAGNAVGILFDELAGDTTPIDPRSYRLTTDDGLVYDVDQFDGVRRVFDQGTETSLTYSRDGVHHSSGIGIDFVRDPQGRISQMRLPDGKAFTYGYSAAGDLTSVTNQVQETTTFTYVANPRYPHYLEDTFDARQIRVSRNEYDPVTGRLVAVIDADGRRIEFSNDLAARTQTIKDRRGNSTTYVYDDSGRVLSETNALGETITRSYDGEGNVLSETDPLQHTTRRTYSASGNLESETNPLLQTVRSTYNAKNQTLTKKDAENRTVLTNAYDVRSGQLLTSSTDALNQTTTFGYVGGTGIFGTGQLESITDPTGASTAFGYNFDGYKNRETDALNHSTTLVIDSLGRTKETRTTRTVTAADGSTRVETLTTVYTLDDRGRVTATLYPDGSTTTTRYNGNDQPEQQCDGLQRCTETQYNARGLVERIDYPDGTFEAQTYDPNGNLESQTDRAGRTTKFVYDAANRLTDTIYPDPNTDDGNDDNNPRSVTRYDDAGRVEESIDENRQITRYRYDDANRRTHVIRTATTTAGEATMVDEYDVHGRRRASVDAENHRTEYRYDAAGRLTETIHPDAGTDDGDLTNNPRTRIEYDAVGRKTAETDEQQRTTRYAYDKLGRLTTVVLANPVSGANPPLVNGESPDAGTLTTRYRYDEVGNKIEQIDAEGRRTRFEYDAMGRETARTLPEGQRETKQYNAAGELTAYTDFNGKTTRYRYDAGGRLEHIDYPVDADVTMQSNGVGERTSVTDGRGDSAMDFDRRGRVVESRDADGGRIEYQYDDAGNLLARISPSQSLVYTYDARRRLETVTRTVDGEAPTVTRYEYDQDGNRHAMVGGDGVRTEYGYDRRHRLTNLIKKSAAGALMLAMTYTVDGSGMRTAVAESDATGPVRTVGYSYDGARRLTQESIDHRDAAKDRVTTWTYDDVGNRLTQTLTAAGVTESTVYGYDDNDRLETESRTGGAVAGTTTYTYDDQGNTLSKTGPSGATTYRYDDANRLVQAITSQATTTYVYNADGLRVRQTVTPTSGSATTTWYVQDSAYPYAQVIEQYTSLGSGPKQLAATFTFADGLVSQTRYGTGSPVTRFVQADGFGSTRWLTDATGVITDTIDYDAFGNEIGRTGTTDVEHLYRGEAFDPNVGFYYLRARWFEPTNGRFGTQDTFRGVLADPFSLHKYSYTPANPVNYLDPSGNSFMAAAGFDLMLSMDFQAAFRTASAQQGKQQMSRLLFGRPPGDLGIIGEAVLDMAINAIIGHVGIDFDSKQQYGTSVHESLKSSIKSYSPLPGYTVEAEPFYGDKNSPGEHFGKGRPGSLGVDVIVKHNGKRVIAFELKTGNGMSESGFAERKKRIGTSVIQIRILPNT